MSEKVEDHIIKKKKITEYRSRWSNKRKERADIRTVHRRNHLITHHSRKHRSKQTKRHFIMNSTVDLPALQNQTTCEVLKGD